MGMRLRATIVSLCVHRLWMRNCEWEQLKGPGIRREGLQFPSITVIEFVTADAQRQFARSSCSALVAAPEVGGAQIFDVLVWASPRRVTVHCIRHVPEDVVKARDTCLISGYVDFGAHSI
jgi:hypothetical protein